MRSILRSCTISGWVLLNALLTISGGLVAQPTPSEEAIPIGRWRTHFSYRTVQHLAVTPVRVYGAATNGLFYVSRGDNALQLLTKTDGLGGVGVVALAYEPTRDALMLAYRSGRIDVILENQIISFTLLEEANQEQEETIYGIHWQTPLAFVSTSRGVRVLTLSSDEAPTIRILESYTQLGREGEPLAIFDATTSADSIFLATANGVISNALGPSVNRQDFGTWRRWGVAEGLPPTPVRHVVHRAGTTYAAFDSVGLFSRRSGSWQPTSLTTNQPFHSLKVATTELVATFGDQVATLDAQGMASTVDDPLITVPQAATIDEQGTWWVADQRNGLLRSNGDAFTSLLPEGPASDTISRIRHVGQRMVALPATPAGVFSAFTEGRWSIVSAPSVTQPFSDVAWSEADQQYYLATLGSGLVRWDGEQAVELVSPPPSPPGNLRLTALAQPEDRLWVGRAGRVGALLTYQPTEDRWQEFSNPSLSATYPRQIVIDRSGYAWMIVGDSSLAEPGRDLMVFDEAANQVQTIRTNVNAGDMPGDRVTALAVDQDGLVWIGGSQGVAYAPNSFGIFDEVVVVKPVFDRQALLRDEYVTSLAVDGGNRKWIGTRNGLWLFSDTGEELIHHFTTDNSPLVSDHVLDITINGTDGEVFIATDRGLVSYRGTATQATSTHQTVRVFPNPVRSGFDGTVGIQGLAAGATLKITSVAGTLVQELEAQGGTATWDARNYAGQRVSTGVYLLFSATANGEETYVGKLAVIP